MGASDWQDLVWLAAIATCLKVLLVPTYHSTDFEVHRHWLAITHSLPLQNWYSDESSEWTLDYPPFFAFFERFLSLFAGVVDPQLVELIEGQNYASDRAVLFQRATVMAADVVLYWGLLEICRNLSTEKRRLVYVAVIFSPGLFIVDHMHFQYNGFLFGMLLLSLAALKDGRDLIGGVWFAILVCFKHLFAVAGPVYFVYLLRHHCRGPMKISRFLRLAGAVLGIVAIAFGPFAYYGQIGQVMKRLFPFGRGLCHAYWAPNLWALYNAADKVIAFLLRMVGFHMQPSKAGMTRGLVGDFTPYAVLPQITPSVSAGLVLFSMLPCLVQIWRWPRQSSIIRCVAYAYACGFMYGWHVHEKASLHIVIPLSLVAVESLEDASNFFLLSTVSYYSLFPLLFETKEYPIKVVLLLLHTLLLWVSFSASFCISGRQATKEATKEPDEKRRADHSPQKSIDPAANLCHGTEVKRDTKREGELLGRCKQTYLVGLIFIEVYGQFLHPFLLRGRLPFLPLMLISVYCGLGMLYFWAGQLCHIIFH